MDKSTKAADASAQTKSKTEKTVKTPKAKKPAPSYKTLTVQFNKTDKKYEPFDENGQMYTAEDAPRQIMMHLAHKAGQVLYFRGKKWRRKKLDATVTVAPVPTANATESVNA